MKHIKGILKVWGWICLFFSVPHVASLVMVTAKPSIIYNPGPTGAGEWIGMGLISLGLARVIDLLEKK